MCDFSIHPHADQEYSPPNGLDTEWNCELDAVQTYKGSSLCIFHLPVQLKSDKDVRDSFIELIERHDDDKIELIGSQFGELDLSSRVIDGGSNQPIDLRYSKFDESLILDNCNILHPISLDFCSFEESKIHSSNAEFYYDFDLTYSKIGVFASKSSIFHKKVDFRRTTVENRFDVAESNFNRDVSFYGMKFCTEWEKELNESPPRGTPILINLSDVVFSSDVIFNEAKFYYVAAFRNITVEKEIQLNSVVFNTMEANIQKERNKYIEKEEYKIDVLEQYKSIIGRSVIRISGSINKIELSTKSGSGVISIGGEDTEITSGRIPLNDLSGYLIYFWNVSIGQLRLKKRTIDQEPEPVDFSRARFNSVIFDGFAFGQYKEDLQKIEYNITEFYRMGLLQIPEPDKEEVYRNARKAASSQGESDIASKFYINEMEARTGKIRERIIDNKESMTKRMQKILIYTRLRGFQLTAGYGEKPWKVIVVSGITITLASFLYPLLGGLRESGQPSYNIANYLADEISAGELFINSIYFSLVSFSTVGYGDLKPVGIFSKIVASVESLAGGLLIALLIFTLGQRSAR